MPRRLLIPLGLVLATGAFAFFPLMALDLPLHLKTGEIIVDSGRVPRTEVTLHTPTAPFVNDKWLHQVVVHCVDRVGGAAALVLLRIALAAAIALALYGMARRLTDPGPAALAAFLVMPLVVHRLALRPELWTYLLTAVFAWQLLARGNPWRAWLVLLPLQVVWVNLHVYFPIGVMLPMALALPWLVRDGIRVALPRLLLAPALAAACVLNPSGLDGLVHPLEVGRSLSLLGGGALSEMVPIWSPIVPWALPRIVFVGLLPVALLGLARHRFRVPAGVALVAVPLLATPGLLHRNLPLAAIGAALLLAAAPPVRSPRLTVIVPVLAVVVAALVALGPLSDPAGDDRSFGGGWAEGRFPEKAAAFLVERKPPGEVFNDIATGGYYAYRAYPQKRVFINGNTSGYSLGFLRDYRRVLERTTPHRALTKKYDVTHFLLRHDQRATRLLVNGLFSDAGLVLVYYDDVATVFLAREIARGLPDHRRKWLDEVLPRVRDVLFTERHTAGSLIEQAGKALMDGNLDEALYLAKKAYAADPWEARTFRLFGTLYRMQGKTKLEVSHWRIGEMLEGRPLVPRE